MLRVVVKQAPMGNTGKISTWCLGQANRKIRIAVRFFFLLLLGQECVMKPFLSLYLGVEEFGWCESESQ